MSSLDKIQKLSKLGKILCSIVFVFCVIGIIGSVVGIAFLAAGVDVALPGLIWYQHRRIMKLEKLLDEIYDIFDKIK